MKIIRWLTLLFFPIAIALLTYFCFNYMVEYTDEITRTFPDGRVKTIVDETGTMGDKIGMSFLLSTFACVLIGLLRFVFCDFVEDKFFLKIDKLDGC